VCILHSRIAIAPALVLILSLVLAFILPLVLALILPLILALILPLVLALILPLVLAPRFMFVPLLHHSSLRISWFVQRQ
jgi:hypothetical protein